jgi:hypothetical protein
MYHCCGIHCTYVLAALQHCEQVNMHTMTSPALMSLISSHKGTIRKRTMSLARCSFFGVARLSLRLPKATCQHHELIAIRALSQPCKPGSRLVELPAQCQLTYDSSSDPRLLALISQVPAELWGAKLALQVSSAPQLCSWTTCCTQCSIPTA